MKDFTTYLHFDGNCREAMTFYGKCLDVDVQFSTFAEAPGAPPEAADRIMHSRITKGSVLLMASDGLPGGETTVGNNFSISIDCESSEEVDRLFAAFSEGGKVGMPVQDTFWGAHFGMATDKFGIHWMFNHQLPPKA